MLIGVDQTQGSAFLEADALSAASSSATLSPTSPITITGTLSDTTTPGRVMPGRTITLTGSYTVSGQLHTITRTATTDQVGNWNIPLTTADVSARFTWQAAYAGENGFHASQSTTHILAVQPTLTTTSNLTWKTTKYTGKQPTTATLSGISTPAMTGATLTVQTKLAGTTKWVASGITVTIAADGTYSTPFTFNTAVSESIRFTYTGKASGPWLSTKSPGRLFVIS